LGFDSALTSGPGEATRIAREAVRQGRPAVVAAGGDGTINEVVNGFFEDGKQIPTDTRFGVLPLGTGGDFRRTFGIPLDPEAAARILAGGRERVIDAGRATVALPGGGSAVRHFVNIADAGIGGDVVDRVNHSSKALGGDATFMLASLISLLRWKNRPMKARIDGELFELPAAQQVVIANCRFFGSGMMMAPDADPTDGLFDVVLVGDVGMIENLRGLSKIKAGKHLQERNPKLTVVRGRRVEVESPAEVRVEMDGEQPGLLPASFEIMPGALRLLVPA
jgi:YegS/Rv2252/BmrU family lipid kinase